MIRSTTDSPDDARDTAIAATNLPKPRMKKSWWPFPLVWILPILAAGLTAYYGFTHLQQRGTQIVINFTDGSGIKANETMVTHLGVEIGTVQGIDLSDDKKLVRVSVTLTKSEADFAKEGAVFWTVRPQISVENVSGLNTVLSGPYIEAMPGNGALKTEFDGLQKAPPNYGPGCSFVLHTPRLEHLAPDAPVYYRGITVGMIKELELSPDSSGVDVHIFVRHRFTGLIQTDTKFWLVKGADIKGGILSGLQLKLGSLQEIVSGGVTFATPETGEGIIAKDGYAFPLYDDPKKDWLDWSPRIQLGPEDPNAAQKAVDLPHTPEAARSLVN